MRQCTKWHSCPRLHFIVESVYMRSIPEVTDDRDEYVVTDILTEQRLSNL